MQPTCVSVQGVVQGDGTEQLAQVGSVQGVDRAVYPGGRGMESSPCVSSPSRAA